VIDKLEARALVERRAIKDDRRVKLLHLTPEGIRMRTKLATALAQPPEWMLSLSDEEQRQLRDILYKALAHEGL
jgi:DNA-binding MarR family transcriptional regulator